MQASPENFQTARAIALRSSRQTIRSQVGGLAGESWYRFRLGQRSQFNLQLKGLRANADVELVQDRNQNGRLDLGEVVASSRAVDRRRETINIQGLERGDYLIRILSKSGSTTPYRLSLSARSTSKTSFTYEVIQRTNAIRQAQGLHTLALNTQLEQAARSYAKSMATQDFFSHRGADGSTWQQRIRSTGYSFSDAAENLAIGHPTPSRVVNGWMNSPGHRRNMLAYQLQEIGVGYYYLKQDRGRIISNHYWAQSFGTPSGTPGTVQDPFEQPFPSRNIQEFFNKLDR